MDFKAAEARKRKTAAALRLAGAKVAQAMRFVNILRGCPCKNPR